MKKWVWRCISVPRHYRKNPRLIRLWWLVAKMFSAKTAFAATATKGWASDKFARIAGQQPAYLKLTLQRYKSGGGIRMDPLMADSTRLLSNADMDAVIAYVSSLSASPQP